MRRLFAGLLYKEMIVNKGIYVITGDLGYKLWDKIRDNFPNRFYNVGSAEQLLIGVGTGLALENKIAICYSITSFLLYRPFEFIRNFINHENIPVKLLGGGLYEDYGNLGFTHHSNEFLDVLNLFKNIEVFVPKNKDDLESMFKNYIYNKKPCFMGLRREV